MNRDHFDLLNSKLDIIIDLLGQIKEVQMEQDVDITALVAAVTNVTTVEGSVVTLLQTLYTQLQAALANSTSLSAADRATLEAQIAQLNTGAATVASAITANTPAAPAAPAPAS